MANAAQEMFERAGFEIVNVDRDGADRGLVDPRAGHGADGHGQEDVGPEPVPAVARRRSNLFVVDGSSHVSASCQNPTWTIMALAWRSCDYLATEFRKGNL